MTLADYDWYFEDVYAVTHVEVTAEESVEYLSVKDDSLKKAFLQFCNRLEVAHFRPKLAKPGIFVIWDHLGPFWAHLNQFGQKTQTAICPKRFGVKKQLFVTFTSMPFFATVGQNRAKRFICNLSSNHSNFSQVTQHQHHQFIINIISPNTNNIKYQTLLRPRPDIKERFDIRALLQHFDTYSTSP